uniref:Uncharacterized protein n=1 Tax=Arundo donax TaxID=35708 RepID=A0A0A9E263_ARUDO
MAKYCCQARRPCSYKFVLLCFICDHFICSWQLVCPASLISDTLRSGVT